MIAYRTVRNRSKAVAALQAESGHPICRPEADPLNVRDGGKADIAKPLLRMHDQLAQGWEKSVIAARIKPAKAVSRGTLTVNGAVMSMMFGVPALAYAATLLLGFEGQTAGPVAGLAFLASWPLAWLTWSLLIVRWRVWAYERVDDLAELKVRAVAAGLIWRDGHFFERTEIRTEHQRKRIREIEQAWAAKGGDWD